jgi:hypothetical protein
MRSFAGRYKWLLFFIALFAGLFVAARWFEHVSLYIPNRVLQCTPAAYGLVWEQVSIRSGGAKLACWLLDGPSPSAPLIVFLHGNGDNVSVVLPKCKILRDLGFAVLMVDYRGYGASTGFPTEGGLYNDAVAAFDWAQARHPSHIVVYGHSLGTGVATELALRRRPDGLVLESPFTSIRDMGKVLYPFLPVNILVSQKYDTLSKISSVACPLLVIHGAHDELIPPDMGKRVYDTARNPKTFALLPGGHNDIYKVSGPAYKNALAAFLHRYLKEAGK